MKIQDNRHLKTHNQVEIGDMVLTKCGKYYLFAHEEGGSYPVVQIDVSNFEVVNGFHKNKLYEFKEGSEIEDGEFIKEIYKNKNLIIDIRS